MTIQVYGLATCQIIQEGGMVWRADDAYEKAQREESGAWRKSLTWGDWLR